MSIDRMSLMLFDRVPRAYHKSAILKPVFQLASANSISKNRLGFFFSTFHLPSSEKGNTKKLQKKNVEFSYSHVYMPFKFPR